MRISYPLGTALLLSLPGLVTGGSAWARWGRNVYDPGEVSELFLSGQSACHEFSPPIQDRCEMFKVCVKNGEKQLTGEIAAPGIRPEQAALKYEKLGEVYVNDESLIYKAAESLDKAYELAKSAGMDFESRRRILGKLALAQLKLGETTNCTLNHNQESCIFPLSENARHKDKEGSRAAKKSLLEYLKLKPESYHARWLLNIVAMTLGEFPGGVPKEYRLPKSAVTSKAKFPRFSDIAMGLDIFDHHTMSGGALIDDLNGDNLNDIVLSSRDPCGPTQLYLNDGKGGFVDKSAGSGLETQTGVTQILQADFDNDGLPDLYLTRGGWDNPGRDNFYNAPVYNTLMKNLGNGHFKDVTEEVGLKGDRSINISAVWVDINNDGWIDLINCSERRSPEVYINHHGHFELDRNSGIQLGPHGSGCKGISAGDLNNDGWVDIVVGTMGGENQIFLNQGNGKFKRVDPTPIADPKLAYPTWIFDYNNDGWNDILIAPMNKDLEEYARQEFGKPYEGDTIKLYENRGGKFVDVTKEKGLVRTTSAMGANFGDLDNDGYPDFLLGTDCDGLGDIMPNLMYHNDRGRKFTDITIPGGFGNLQKGHGVAFGDVNNDGYNDVLIELGGAFPGDAFYPSLYLNPGFEKFRNNWVSVKLEGVKANRSAIGARIRADIVESGHPRSVYATVNSGNNFGANSLTQNIGIGKATEIAKLTITWPGSQTVQTFTHIAKNQHLRIVEGQQPEVLHLSPIPMNTKPVSHHHHHQEPFPTN